MVSRKLQEAPAWTELWKGGSRGQRSKRSRWKPKLRQDSAHVTECRCRSLVVW